MPKPFPSIIVDVHEDNSGLADRLKAMNIGNVEVMSLVTGDVAIRYDGYLCGWEIKRNQDYNNSLHDGRLHDQIHRMIHTYDYPGLIVEGWHPYVGDDTTEDDLRNTVDMHRKTIRTFNRRIATFETKDMDDTLSLLGSIISDIRDGKFRYIRRRVILEDTPDAQVKFLCGLPNISVARATEILELFGCPENAMSHVDEWIDVKGITESRIEIIKKVLGEEMVR